MELLFLALLCAPVFVIMAVNRNRRQRAREFAATVEIAVDQRGAHRVLADGRREEVTWDEVNEVDVFTTRKGPHKDAGGAVVLYGSEARGCIIPMDVVESSGLLLHITRLPGLKIDTIIEAMTAEQRREASVNDNPMQAMMPRPWQRTTVCWKRPEADATDDAAAS